MCPFLCGFVNHRNCASLGTTQVSCEIPPLGDAGSVFPLHFQEVINSYNARLVLPQPLFSRLTHQTSPLLQPCSIQERYESTH